MITHDLQQGSKEWHEFRAAHFPASEASVMLGISQYKSRAQLLRERATGIIPNVDAATQSRFDAGHRFEELARPLAERIIGQELFPVVGSEGKLSASFDGLTMDESVCWEHKSANASLLTSLRNMTIPEQYLPQMEQQLMLSGAERCLFSATKWEGDVLIEEAHCWYISDPAMRDRILQGWTQFAIDLENYQHIEHAEKPKAEVCIELPALFIHARGQITDSNMQAYGEALTAKLAEVRAIQLVTDQDFSNAKEAAKLFREQCKKLELTKEAMLSQTVTIGEAARMMDAWHEDLRVTALELEKKVEKEDLAKKRVMVGEAGIAFSAHIEALEAETRPIQLNVPRPNFAEAIKGKRNYASMQDALDTALAQGRIDADAIAKDVRAKLAWYNESTGIENGCYGFLFNDLQQVIVKPFDDFKLTVTTRIEAQQKAEAAKLEAERARIQAQEEAKARAAQDALLAAERVKMEAEVRAKAEAESKAQRVLDDLENETLAQQDAARIAVVKELERTDALDRAVEKEQAKAVAIEERRKQAQLDAQAQPFKLSGAKTVVAQAITSRRPNRAELLDAIATTFGTTNEAALDWILQEFRGDIQHEERKAA